MGSVIGLFPQSITVLNCVTESLLLLRSSSITLKDAKAVSDLPHPTSLRFLVTRYSLTMSSATGPLATLDPFQQTPALVTCMLLLQSIGSAVGQKPELSIKLMLILVVTSSTLTFVVVMVFLNQFALNMAAASIMRWLRTSASSCALIITCLYPIVLSQTG